MFPFPLIRAVTYLATCLLVEELFGAQDLSIDQSTVTSVILVPDTSHTHQEPVQSTKSKALQHTIYVTIIYFTCILLFSMYVTRCIVLDILRYRRREFVSFVKESQASVDCYPNALYMKNEAPAPDAQPCKVLRTCLIFIPSKGHTVFPYYSCTTPPATTTTRYFYGHSQSISRCQSPLSHMVFWPRVNKPAGSIQLMTRFNCACPALVLCISPCEEARGCRGSINCIWFHQEEKRQKVNFVQLLIYSP